MQFILYGTIFTFNTLTINLLEWYKFSAYDLDDESS